MPVRVIAFDADDTLWVNEPYFRDTEKALCELMKSYFPEDVVNERLFKVEIDNLPLYGYGIKGFMLSMIETAIQLSGHTLPIPVIEQILSLGKEMLEKPVELLDDVEEILVALQGKYRLILATKGDLLDQQRKLMKSGLGKYFHHIEVMIDKRESDYQSLIAHLDISPDEFMMVGNSLKSDIVPVLALGGHAVHVPFHTTWIHERVEDIPQHQNFRELSRLKELLHIL